MVMLTIASFGRKHIEKATVVADTIFYAENMSNVANANQASYYRLLMTTGSGINKKDVFKDYYMNGNLRAEGGYSFTLAIYILAVPFFLTILIVSGHLTIEDSISIIS